MMTALAIASLGAAAVPPPAEQIAADCTAPVYASDRLVCVDPELRGIDEASAEMVARVGPLDPTADSLIEDHAAWFRRRSRCAFQRDHRACLAAAYRDRALVLSAMIDPPPAQTAIACSGPWARHRLRIATTMAGAARITEQDRLLAVATPTASRADWQPAVALRARGDMILLAPLGASTLRCTRKP